MKLAQHTVPMSVDPRNLVTRHEREYEDGAVRGMSFQSVLLRKSSENSEAESSKPETETAFCETQADPVAEEQASDDAMSWLMTMPPSGQAPLEKSGSGPLKTDRASVPGTYGVWADPSTGGGRESIMSVKSENGTQHAKMTGEGVYPQNVLPLALFQTEALPAIVPVRQPTFSPPPIEVTNLPRAGGTETTEDDVFSRVASLNVTEIAPRVEALSEARGPILEDAKIGNFGTHAAPMDATAPVPKAAVSLANNGFSVGSFAPAYAEQQETAFVPQQKPSDSSLTQMKKGPSDATIETPAPDLQASRTFLSPVMTGQEPMVDDATETLSTSTGEVSVHALGPAALVQHTDQPAFPTGTKTPIMQQILSKLPDVTVIQSEQIDITLSPAELGRVRLSASNTDQGVVLVLQVERPETLDLMRRHLPELMNDLREFGFADISYSNTGGGHQPRANQQADVPNGATDEPIAMTSWIGSDGSLDLRV